MYVEDTAQPIEAAETEPVSKRDALAAAANAFKVNLGQEEAPERPRGPDGKFVSTREPEEGEEGEEVEEIEATEEDEPGAGEAEAGAESHDETEEGEEAADEAQPAEPDLPASWPAEQAEAWKSLPPETQAFIRQREGERERAVNAKFQEAANVLKANEAIVTEAQANRQNYLEWTDTVLSLVVPQEPPMSMLDRNSDDYDPDEYHFRKAQHDKTVTFLNHHASQRQQLAAQEEAKRFDAINNATRDKFIQAVPDVADQAKAPEVFRALIDYAVSQGAPPETFESPTTALEWHVLWKAREYDRLQAAKAKVRTEPKPEPRKAQPAVRPGVTTPRAAIEKASREKALGRLAREGSVQAGAAALKHLMKGAL